MASFKTASQFPFENHSNVRQFSDYACLKQMTSQQIDDIISSIRTDYPQFLEGFKKKLRLPFDQKHEGYLLDEVVEFDDICAAFGASKYEYSNLKAFEKVLHICLDELSRY